jgi:hypothetical protein
VELNINNQNTNLMETIKTYEDKLQAAIAHVKEIKAFYYHLTTYICSISFLVFINLKYSPNDLWFFWSAIGWGFGLAAHANRVFNWAPAIGKDWEERKIQEIMNKQNQQKNG